MENASKALLIAGAILIVILIIGVGMLVFSSTTGTIDEAVKQMSSTEKDMYNQQFTQYEGTRVNGSNVKALLQKIRNNNNTNSDIDAKQVDFSFKASANAEEITDISQISTAISKVNTAGTYTVKVEDKKNGFANDGLMDTVTITYYTAGSSD